MKKKRLATTNSAVALRPANYVELMAGWCDLFEVLFAVTWIFGMVSFYRTMNDERSVATAALVSAILLLITWIPGLATSCMFQDHREVVGRFLGVYKSHSIFADGIRIAIDRYRRVLPNHVIDGGVGATMVFGLGVMIFNLLSIFCPGAWLFAMILGAVLSLGGFLAISICVAKDCIKEVIKRYQIM